jgi:hypothetical protein
MEQQTFTTMQPIIKKQMMDYQTSTMQQDIQQPFIKKYNTQENHLIEKNYDKVNNINLNSCYNNELASNELASNECLLSKLNRNNNGCNFSPLI